MTTVGANTFTFTAPNLPAGQHTASVTAVNAVGESSLSALVTFTVTAVAGSGGGTTTITAPGAPTIGTVTAGAAGSGQASVPFTAPSNNGGASIISYTVTSSGGQTGTGTGSPITVSGLSLGSSQTFTVRAINSQGAGSASSASNSVTIPTAVVVAGPPNLLVDAVASVTGSTSLFQVNGNAPLPNLSVSGGHLTASSTGSPSEYWIQPVAYTPVAAGTTYTALATYLPSGAGVTGFSQIQWESSSGAITYTSGTLVTMTQGTTQQLAVSAAAPAGTVGATVQVTVINDPNAGGNVQFSKLGLFAGSGITTWSAGTGVAATVPGAPTIGAVTGGSGQAVVNFTPPSNTGGSPITSYTVTATSA